MIGWERQSYSQAPPSTLCIQQCPLHFPQNFIGRQESQEEKQVYENSRKGAVSDIPGGKPHRDVFLQTLFSLWEDSCLERRKPHTALILVGPTYHSISFKSLDIIHAKSNITMADCKKKRRLRSKAAVLKRRVHIGAGLHTWARPELSRVPAKPLKIEGLPS